MTLTRKELAMVLTAIGDKFENTMILGFGNELGLSWANLKLKFAEEYSRVTDKELKKNKIEKLKPYYFNIKDDFMADVVKKLNEIIDHLNEVK